MEENSTDYEYGNYTNGTDEGSGAGISDVSVLSLL